MTDFDPDKYLAKEKTDNSFDPDAYLSDGEKKKDLPQKSSNGGLPNHVEKSQSDSSTSDTENIDVAYAPPSISSQKKKTEAPKDDGFKQGNYDLSHLKNFDPNTPDYKVKQDLEEQLRQQRKPEAVKKADLKIKEVDDQIVSVSRNLNDVRKAQSQNIKTLNDLKNQLSDPSIPEDQRNQLAEVYNKTLNDATITEDTEKKIFAQATKLQQAKSTLNKVYEIQAKLDADENDDFLKATGNFLSHVYNAVPETISGIGSMVESVGDNIAHPLDVGVPDAKTTFENFKSDQKDDKITDVIGNAIQGMGNDLKTDTDQKYDDKHYISSTIGDIVGSIAVSAIPGGIAAKYGKGIQIITGATTATMQMADGVHSKAKEVGLSDQDAGLMTLAIAPISGLLEVWGASNIIENVSGKKIIKELIDESAKKLAGKEITKEAVFSTVSDTFKEVSKKYGLNAAKSAGEEGITEGLQGEVEKVAENAYDEIKGKDTYGTKVFSAAAQLDVAKQAALGAAAGSAFGVISGISSPKSIYEKAVELKNDPDKLSQFRDMLDTEVKAGHIEIEKADAIKANINAMMVADDKVPPAIKDLDKRLKAVELIKEKTALEEEVKGMDKAITTPQRDKIKVINSELEAIATGKEPVKMERRDLGKKEKAAPEPEIKPEAKATETPAPLTEEEQVELKDLTRDHKRIGLEGDDLNRYEELNKRATGQTEIKFEDKVTENETLSKEKPLSRSDIKESTENSVFPKQEKKKAEQKPEVTEPSIVVQAEKSEATPEKEAYVKEKIKKLKADKTAQFDKALLPVYKSKFENEFELLNEHKIFEDATDNEAATERLPDTDSSEQEPNIKAIEEKEAPTTIEGVDEQIAEIEKALKPVHALKGKLPAEFKKAVNHNVSSAYDQVLQHFIGGGKINAHALHEMFGGKDRESKVSSERELRKGYLEKGGKPEGSSDSYSALDELAHKMWLSQKTPGQFTDAEFKTAIDEAVRTHNSRKSMVSAINDAFDQEEISRKKEEENRAAAEENSPALEASEKEVVSTTKLNDESDVVIGNHEEGLPFQKVLSSDKFNKSQKRIAKSVTNVVKALSKIAPNLKVILHETESSFENAAYEANKKLGQSEKRAKKDVGGRAFYFGKGDHSIHINLPKVRSNTLFHEGIHPILNAVEELRPGTIDAMFDQLKAIEKTIKQDGKYTEDFASAYGESVRKMEAITEFMADVADGKIDIEESALSKIKQFFGKLLKAFGIDIKSFTKDDIISLAKKIQKGFETGEAIDLETNRAIREIISGKYQQKTLAAVELEKLITKAEDEYKAAKNAFDKKRKDLDTEIVKDQEDLFGERKSTEGSGMFDERVDTKLRDKIVEPFKVRLEKATENLATLKKKLQDEEGKEDLLLFQDPTNSDKLPEEDILWALKTFKKLNNDYSLFHEKLSKTEEGRDLLGKNLFGAMWEYNSEKPQASKSDRLKALSDSLHKAEFITPELKEKIEEHGLRAEVFSHEEAREIADQAIKALGIDGAVDLAKDRLQGSVKAFVFGAAIDHYAKLEAESTNTFEKDALAQKGADIAEEFQKNAENYGRFISAIGDYYKNSPLIIQKTETNKLRTQAKEALEKMKASKNKVTSVKKELDATAKRDIKEPKEKTPRKTLADPSARTAKRNELLARWKSLNNDASGIQKQVSGYSQEQTDIMVEMGAIHVADGAWVFPSWYKKMKTDFGISEKTAKEVWETEKMPSELDENQRTISQFITEDFGDTKEYKEQQEKILNKYFPKKSTEKQEVKQKEEHEKIIEQYNSGVFSGGQNQDGEEFQKLFYEKLGIVNPDSPEVQARIGEYANQISKAPEGSIMQREAQEDLLTYIAQVAYRTKMEAGASKLSSVWYANILSSPGTHLRNIQYNTITSALSQPFLLMEKALLKKDFKAIGTHATGIVEGFKKGLVESGRIMKTGRSSRFDRVSAKSELERGKYIKPFVLPGRGLKASDIFFTDMSYNLKLSELARQLVIKENPSFTNEEINNSVNELLGNTKELKESAKVQAEKEMRDFYGEDWKTKKGSGTIFKIRQFELMEASIPENLKEEAAKWSKKSLLTSKPTGVLGVVADGINHWNEKLYFTKFVIPFVNVPFNLVNAIIDRSPLGLITAIRKAEGFGSYKENLSDDEVKELYIKIVNYAIATTALAAMNGDGDDDDLVITGAQTGDYMDNKGVIRGGGLEPYSLYIKGRKVLSYKTSPWAAALLAPGYIRDAKLYGKSEDLSDIAAYSALNWLLFINDQSAMQGVQGLVSTIAESKKMNAETAYTTTAKYMQNMIVPYSGALKFFNNNTKALLEAPDKRPIDPWEYLTKDVPLFDDLARTRVDHFGQTVRENFDVPLLPIGHRGLLSELSEKSPYYKMCKEKEYYPAFSTQRKMFVDGNTVTLSKKELDDINTDRGQLVKQALDSKNIFIPKDGEEDETLSEMTTKQYLETLDKDEFKKRMDDLFNEATKLARIRKYGEKVGITAKDIDKAKKAIAKSGGEAEYSKEKANKKLKEEFDETGTIQIVIDAY